MNVLDGTIHKDHLKLSHTLFVSKGRQHVGNGWTSNDDVRVTRACTEKW